MNTSCDENMNEEFKRACELSEKDFTHKDFVDMLEKGDIIQKQLAALNISMINNENEAKLLLNNLTGCDGKIREAVAYKINTILDKDIEKRNLFIGFNLELAVQTFADATIDINGNICKFVLNTVEKLKSNKDFSKLYAEKIVNMIFVAFSEIDKFIYKDKKYVINKQLFKLYWCLEAVKVFKIYIESQTLEQILLRASREQEYTIREKVAQILADIKDQRYINLKEKLKTDLNYYVRQAII